MAKAKVALTSQEAPTKGSLAVDEPVVDPILASLFASSSGPVKIPQKPPTANVQVQGYQEKKTANGATGASSAEEDELSELSGSEGGGSEESGSEEETDQPEARPRKRRRMSEDEDLEADYLDRLVREGEKEQRERQKSKKGVSTIEASEDSSDTDGENVADGSASEEDVGDEAGQTEVVIRHEALGKSDEANAEDRGKRTVFLSNVSTSAIKSKSARKTLISHIKTALDSKLAEGVESLRFRSTAFVSDAGPKKAAYAKKELMDQTMKSTNAYVVLSSEPAARKVASRLNGSIVLDRHLRADHLANPSKVDHRRCVFVGNLSFVDEEISTNDAEDGHQKRPKAKEPADVEEGLWRTFARAGKVESVRVVRDKETRISKGFAYVQFDNENGVEAALLMNEKKYPPMLPRKLRVMRAKRVKSRGQGDRVESSSRSGKQHGRADVRKPGRMDGGRRASGGNKSGNFVFEGHRASSTSKGNGAKPKKRHATKPTTRSSRRGADFKATGGKRKRE